MMTRDIWWTTGFTESPASCDPAGGRCFGDAAVRPGAWLGIARRFHRWNESGWGIGVLMGRSF